MSASIASDKAPSVVVIGNFDGVHRGHRAVLRQARGLAAAKELVCQVLTFDPHPNEVLGRGIPPRLTTLDRRIELLCRHGAHAVVVEPFTIDFAAWSPEHFARDLLRARLGAKVVVVGRNFRFGAKRAGDFDTLARLGRELGFEAASADVAGDVRGPFSSTRVREAIGAGDLAEATNVLGRWHSLSGVVERGDQLGRTLGFPTANLGSVEEILPPHGVYAVVVDTLSKSGSESAGRVAGQASALGPGVMNLGVRPTVGGVALRNEVHLFDFDGDLYGARLRVHLVERLRAEAKFGSLDDLRAQIAKDAAFARVALANLRPVDGAYG